MQHLNGRLFLLTAGLLAACLNASAQGVTYRAAKQYTYIAIVSLTQQPDTVNRDASYLRSSPYFGESDNSIVDAQTQACEYLGGKARYLAENNMPPFLVAWETEKYNQCMAPESSVRCSKAGFYALAIGGGTVIGSGVQAVGGQDGSTAAGAACGRATQAIATDAAVAACEKARLKRGLTNSKCQIISAR